MQSRFIVLVLLIISESMTSRPVAADDRPRRVLILDSFARGVAPLNEYMLAFRSELTDRWPGPLDLFEVSLESARSPNPEDDAHLVNFIAAHLAATPWISLWFLASPPCGSPRCTASACSPVCHC